MTASSFGIGPLTALDEFREVERLEGEIWGAIDLVPVPVLAVTSGRGAVLLGARATAGRLAGFVYSFPVLGRAPDGSPQPYHWSHLLGVHPDFRGRGLGVALKLAQRESVLALGLNRIEWTYDPLQAYNAHLNFVKLGVVVEAYEENVYGESTSPLHGGLPTDRFICQWLLDREHVVRRLRPVGLPLTAAEVSDAPVVNTTRPADAWLEPVDANLTAGEPRLSVDIPLGFTDMLQRSPDLARRWRLATREIFKTYFAAGYRVIDFVASPDRRRGRYLLSNIRAAE